jgi:LPXTG-motif cell wall-anchored protein
VYTWNETLSLTTAGSTTNWLPYLGILGALIAIAIYAYRRNT